MDTLYNEVCQECSQVITNRYSTSFSMGIKAFDRRFHLPIYSIYGFVRFADEIVDTFHGKDKATLLNRFRQDLDYALEEKVSLNPVLHSFQNVVHKYKIEKELIDAFLNSMEMDLFHQKYEDKLYNHYIYGSAEVVGLMCLRVFCEGNEAQYQHLKKSARRLGAAFQKVNFLRDMKSDFDERGRVYFPGVDFLQFSLKDKKDIEADIQADFDAAYVGILQLPRGVRLGVYLAYVYYTKLFQKICNSTPIKVKQERIRVPDSRKLLLLFSSTLRHRLNLL